MSEWTGGYVADITYTHGYYTELNPERLKLGFLAAGYAFPDAGAACELGFGQGLSTNVHAAASVTQWYGTDFNPVQAGYAQELADASGARARLFDQSFEEFCGRSDLPDFDFIGLHGIWSWISDANRHIITDFIRRKLKVGGVVYISYNTQPGWAPIGPLRDLLTEHSQVMGSPGSGIVNRIDAALAFADKLFASGASYAQANPQIVERLKSLKLQDRSYLAHEYFNKDWVPMSFAQMSSWLGEAKLGFVASANYFDHAPVINLTKEQQELLREVPDRMFRETVYDYLVNTQFRKDYWVRGLRPLTAHERVARLRRMRVVMVMPRSRFNLKVVGALGEGTLQDAVYEPVLTLLAGHRPVSLQEIEEVLKSVGMGVDVVLETVMLLLAKGVIEAAQEDAAIEAATATAARLNRKLCEQARYSHAGTVLASPVTGGGISVAHLEKLFLLSRSEGAAGAEQSARYILQTLALGGHQLLRDGRTLPTPQASHDEAVRLVLLMEAELLPMLEALRVSW